MNKSELFTFIICCFIFVIFIALFIVLLVMLYRYKKKMILTGIDDKELKNEYLKEYKNRKKNKTLNVLGQAISAVLGIGFLGLFTLSMVTRFSSEGKVKDIPILQVCKSDSMSYIHNENTYLKDRQNIEKYGDKMSYQFETYDMLLARKLPGEFELELYDVVIYEVNNINVIHRIIEIEEPNASHPDSRYFRLKGDANTLADKFPVKYEQMKGIYKGEKIAYAGSFVLFLQSPAGWLCLCLILFYVIATPIVEKKIEKNKHARLTKIGYIQKVEGIFNARDHIGKNKKKGNSKKE